VIGREFLQRVDSPGRTTYPARFDYDEYRIDIYDKSRRLSRHGEIAANAEEADQR
jgi:hypothetical protein